MSISRCMDSSHSSRVRAVLLALFFMGIGMSTGAHAQSLCDSLLRISYIQTGNCCYRFTLHNYQQSNVISRLTAQVYSNSADSTAINVITTPPGSSVSGYPNGVAFNFANGLRFGSTDSLWFCLNGNSSTYWVIFNWWNNQSRTICSDTFVLNCTPPSQGCMNIRKESIECIPNAGGLPAFNYRFSLTNQSNFTARYLSFTPPSGVTIAPSPLSIGSALASGATRTGLGIVIGGQNARPGSTIVVGVRMCSDSLQRTCCTDSLVITLPQCSQPPQNGCFSILEDSVFCSPNANGYPYEFRLRNNASWTARVLKFRVITPGQGVSVTPNPLSIQPLSPGASGWYSTQISGTQATPGTTVRIVVTMCGDSGTIRDSSANGGRDSIFTEQYCCSDTITVRLPNCGTSNSNCLDITNSRIECRDSSATNANGFSWCFSLRNQSSFRARYLYIVPTDPNVTISPGTITLPLLSPGMTLSQQCVTIFGAGAVPGSTITVLMRMCDSTLQHCCVDSVRIALPRCGQPEGDCCSNFNKRLSQLTNSASSSGFASLRGWMSAGPAPITNVSATIVSSTINGQPAYAYFNGGLIYNPLGPGIVVPPPYGSELRWPGPTVNMNAATGFYFSMKFPPLGSNISRDTLRYCIRFRWTDANCVTCDTVVCFQRIRYRLFGLASGSNIRKDNGQEIASAGGAAIAGSLHANDSGSIQMVLPGAPKELGTIRYVGMTVSSELPIIEATETMSGAVVSVDGGVVSSTFNAAGGAQLSLGMRYAGLGEREALDHHVIVRYVVDAMPQDTLEEEVLVTLRRHGGGDAVEAHYSNYSSVKTYAIHVRNANPSAEKIDRLVITAKKGVKIVAIGPTANETEATVQFGMTGEGRSFVGEEIGGGRVDVAAGATQGPIFVTLAGVDEELYTATIGFATLDANGQVISDGELIVSDPLSNVRDDDATTGSLALRAYPNPANGSATIRFALPQDETNVMLVVTDATGREVTRLIDGESLRSGEHMVFVNTADLASGTYYYTLRTGTAHQTRSMNVVR